MNLSETITALDCLADAIDQIEGDIDEREDIAFIRGEAYSYMSVLEAGSFAEARRLAEGHVDYMSQILSEATYYERV